jgi:hypothetical protein
MSYAVWAKNRANMHIVNCHPEKFREPNFIVLKLVYICNCSSNGQPGEIIEISLHQTPAYTELNLGQCQIDSYINDNQQTNCLVLLMHLIG